MILLLLPLEHYPYEDVDEGGVKLPEDDPPPTPS
jgi:hypothetical protein